MKISAYLLDLDHVTSEVQTLGPIVANLSRNKIYVFPDQLLQWHAYAESLESYISGDHQSSPLNYRRAERAFFENFRNSLSSSESLEEVCRHLNQLLCDAASSFKIGSSIGRTANIRRLGGQKLRLGVRFLLKIARDRELILYPAGILRPEGVAWYGASLSAPENFEFHRNLKQAVEELALVRVCEQNRRPLLASFEKFLAFTQFRSVTELSEAFFESFWDWYKADCVSSSRYHRLRGLYSTIFDTLVSYEARRDPGYLRPKVEASVYLRLARNKHSVLAHSYSWLISGPEADARFAQWAAALSWWVNSKPVKSPEALVSSTKPFIAYLKSLRCPPLSPEDFTRSHVVRQQDSPERTYLQFLEDEGYAGRQIGYMALLDMRRFFEVWHDKFGHAIPDWRAPIKPHDIPSSWSSRHYKTEKEILPIRIIKLLKDIVSENDYAWPKTVAEDYFDVFDSVQDRFVRTWCPTRAVALLTLLVLPIRTIQLRLLDSGEADETYYNRDCGAWVPNLHSLAQAGRQMGFWKRLYDHGTQKSFAGIYITTNKTGLVTSAEFEVGYDIPWDCNELVPHIERLKDWQAQHNPVKNLVSRRDCTCKTLHPNAAVKNLPGYTFLFRDPANRHTINEEPVTHNRMRGFFLKILLEAEHRLRAAGEDVRLVTLSGPEGYLSSEFSLHGLRAAGITHFIKAGVPIQVIAEFVSGHATIMMTLLYTRLGPAYVTDVLDRAQAAIEEGEEEDFVGFLKEVRPDEMAKFVVANDDTSFRNYADTSPGLWSIGLDGICPTGRSMCDVGGERLSQHNNAYYAAVQGGPRNCALCRFFITGPAFLNGQVIAFNNLVFAISEKARELNRLKVQVAEDEAAGKQGRQLERRRNQIDAVEIEIHLMLKTLQARFSLIERSRARTRNLQNMFDESATDAPADVKQPLVTAMAAEEDIRIVLEHTSEFDLVEFVAQACELFPEKAEPSAPLRKGRILDQFLKHNGFEALFYALPEEEALAAGNRLTRFLQEKVGRDRVRSLMDGHATLKSLGIAREFEQEAGPLLGTKTLELSVADRRPAAATAGPTMRALMK